MWTRAAADTAVTVTDLVIDSVVRAATAVPEANSTFAGDHLRLYRDVNVALAVDTPDGLVVPVVAINKQTGMLEGVPDIITRGFVMENSEALLADGARVLAEVIANASLEERTDPGIIKEKLRVELRRFFRKRSGRRPFVLPVIMEI